MKTLSLTQPWATLVAIGAKQIETRSWNTSYRGPLAIHAAKGLGPVGGKRGLSETCGTEPFCSVLNEYGRSQRWKDLADMVTRPLLPQGTIIAIVELYDIRATTTISDAISQQELAFGDYSIGRYAWLLRNAEMLPEPTPARGALGLWEWTKGGAR